MSEQLRMCNWQVVVPTTPANYFHLLRRQLHCGFRKPLIVAAPKKLLRLKECVSTLADMTPGTSFQTVLPDAHAVKCADEDIERIVFCSGKLYYDIVSMRRELMADKDTGAGSLAGATTVVRLEQLSPFPFHEVAAIVRQYPKAEVFWAQEEPKNMGAWHYFHERIVAAVEKLVPNRDIRASYVGRRTMASPASGYGDEHNQEQDGIARSALSR